MERHLSWADCSNVRDLGGLPSSDGRQTRPAAIVRAEFVRQWRPFSARRLPPLHVDRLLSVPSRVNARSRRQLEDDLSIERRRREERSDRDAILATLASLDVAAYLRGAGVDEHGLAAVRSRLV